MERVNYQEAKDWFWSRTLFWLVPAVILSVILHYALPDQVFSATLIGATRPHVFAALGTGITSVGLGLLAALISIEFPWMRLDWRSAFILNAVACALMAMIVATIAGGFALAMVQTDPHRLPPKSLLDAVYCWAEFFIGSSGLWALVFGVWFAVRRDRYFVEQL